MLQTNDYQLAHMNLAQGDFNARDRHMRFLRRLGVPVREIAELYNLSVGHVRKLTAIRRG